MDLDEVAEWEDAVETTQTGRAERDQELAKMTRPAYLGRREYSRPEKIVVDPRKEPKALDVLKFMVRQGSGMRRNRSMQGG